MKRPLPVYSQAKGFSALACEVLDYVSRIFPLFPYSFYSFGNKKMLRNWIQRVCPSLQRVWSGYAEEQWFMHHSGVSLPNSDIAKSEQSLPTYNLGNRVHLILYAQVATSSKGVFPLHHFLKHTSGWHRAEELAWLKHAGRLILEFGATRGWGQGDEGEACSRKAVELKDLTSCIIRKEIVHVKVWCLRPKYILF